MVLANFLDRGFAGTVGANPPQRPTTAAADGDSPARRSTATRSSCAAANGRTERVRYIGVDTPESVKPDTPVECFGNEASDFNKQLVQGREVRLVPDRGGRRTSYGRSLAFVYVGDTFVNAELLKDGYARTIEIEPNTSKAELLRRP